MNIWLPQIFSFCLTYCPTISVIWFGTCVFYECMLSKLIIQKDLVLLNVCCSEYEWKIQATHWENVSSGVCLAWPQGYEAFFMLNSAEHKIYPANIKLLIFENSFLLNIGEHENFPANEYEIFIFISRENFMLSWVEHEKSFITSGPGPTLWVISVSNPNRKAVQHADALL